MKTKFPFDHVLKYDTKEVWVKCNSSITAMGIDSLVKKYYPGYTAKIATDDHIATLRRQFQK